MAFNAALLSLWKWSGPARGRKGLGSFSAGPLSTREDFNQTACKLQWNLLE